MQDVLCPGCGEANPGRARLCGMCRTTLVADGATLDGGKLVTVVTSDLKGSTALGERLDPESLREVLNRYFAVMRVVFESHGGSIEKIIGDAIIAVFGLPFRHDDDAIRAVEAAAETQRALATLNDELEMLWGVRLVNRTGIATGIVHFGRDAEGQHVLIGETMDESTAMEQNAPALEVLMAASAYAEVRDLVEAEPAGPKSPKGSDLQIEAYRLVAVHARAPIEETAPPEPTPGTRVCQVCGEESPERFRYCIACGTSASTAIARDSRKTVTIVFANPKPRTADGRPLEPAAFTDVMARYFEAMKVALERHGGTVEKFIGDAVMAVFGLPVRHEDDALRAVRAAADMQAALPALNEEFGRRHGVELLNHIGVNTGEVIATGDASTGQRLVTGDAVNTAARLEQAAGPAEIILGELTHRLTRNQVEVEVIEPLVLKGKAEPVPAYRFAGIGERQDDAAGPATPFVGREAEMARLAEALFAAVGGRRARLVTVVGDAGVGKSRLIREFASTASNEAGIVRGRCLPYGDGITFWPLAEVVRIAAEISAEDGPAMAVEKIRQLVDRPDWADDRDAITERVASMMGLVGEAFPVSELLWGARRLLECLAAERPLVMIIDDIQSAEATLLEFLDYVLETATDAAVLLVCTARHELLERRQEWSDAHADDMIRLVPLSDSDTTAIVAGLLGDLEPAVQERISSAAGGNPLYAEQIASMLQETGAIRQEGGRWVSIRGSDAISIPPTVQALVAARLDALAAEERAVIEPASVIGMSFAEEAIAELVDADLRDRLVEDLGALVAKQLVRPATSEDVVYRFGHLVIRDTTYGSLLKRIRARLHERFVLWAERVNRERGRETEFEEILGYHLESAFRYRTELGVIDDDARDVGLRAAMKLGSAGRRALARADLPAAESLLRRAAAVLERESPFRLELVIDLGETHQQQGAFDEAVAVLLDALTIATEIGEERLAVRARLIRASVDQLRSGGEGQAAASLAAAKGAIAALEPIGDAAGLARAWRLAMIAHASQAHLEEAAAAAERVIEYAGAAGDRRFSARSAWAIAYILLNGPTPVRAAIPQCEALLENVEGDRSAEAGIESTIAILLAMDGRLDEARERSDRAYAVLTSVATGIMTMTYSIDSSRVDRRRGDLQAAEQDLRRDYEALAALDESYFRSTIAAFLARTLWAAGQPEEALAFSQIAEQLGDVDDVQTQVPWRSARGRVLAARGEHEAARRLASEAVELANGTSDLILRADALADLAEVLEATGDHESAGPPFREALGLYEQKGDVVSAAALRDRIGAVATG
ncbi:MAG TPA: adenylate/guanylate cyclase domain-containing protein [Candidatus Limnocylindrales bacterium]|nr:adenylate/guanylate cyclase domain-containing protein [Candidatus Limnocylindrales bacterium]